VTAQVSDPNLGQIAFEADQGPRFPWTFGAGTTLRPNPHFEILAELGADFRGGWYFFLGPISRF